MGREVDEDVSHALRRVVRGEVETATVALDELDQADEGGALVAVGQRMVLDDARAQ
jgi:hypothetical protein